MLLGGCGGGGGSTPPVDTTQTAYLIDSAVEGIPNPFDIANKSNVALSTLIESDGVTITGLTTASPISVIDGEYSINGGTYTAIAGTISNGQTVKVRHTSSATNGTPTTTTLTIGGISDTFTATTLAIPIDYLPLSGATNVGVYSWIKFNFNQAMDSSTLTPSNLALSGSKTFASCDYNSSTTTVLCKLAENISFAENTLYTLSGTVKNSGGVDVVVDTNFTTGSLNTFGRLRTGQTLCYDSANNTIACTDDNALKSDGYYVSQGLGFARSFDRNTTTGGQETVKDNVTKLIWQDDSSASSVTATWENANNITCQSLNTSTFGGYTDWRLPTIEELYTITNKGTHSPAKFSTFNNFASGFYWSSTTYAGNSGNAWYVDFDSGSDDADDKTNSGYVRCVRAGQ